MAWAETVGEGILFQSLGRDSERSNRSSGTEGGGPRRFQSLGRDSERSNRPAGGGPGDRAGVSIPRSGF